MCQPSLSPKCVLRKQKVVAAGSCYPYPRWVGCLAAGITAPRRWGRNILCNHLHLPSNNGAAAASIVVPKAVELYFFTNILVGRAAARWLPPCLPGVAGGGGGWRPHAPPEGRRPDFFEGILLKTGKIKSARSCLSQLFYTFAQSEHLRCP